MRRVIAWIAPLLLLIPLAVLQPAGAQGTGGTAALLQSARSPQEKMDFADAALTEMRAASKDVSKMLEAAERDKDTARIQCLGKKLATIRALVEVSESSASSMKQAFGSGDAVVADHEFRKIAIALVKVRQFRAEAETCGGTSGQPGSTSVSIIDAGVAYEEVEDGDIDVGDESIENPPDTSPFQ